MAHNGNDLTTNSDLLDQLVTAASRGNRLALEALEVRYGIVVTSAVRARVFKLQNRFIDTETAWAAAARAVHRVNEPSLTDAETPFLAWLALAAEEAVAAPGIAASNSWAEDDGLADADRCALEMHVMGYGSHAIGAILGESKTDVHARIENAKHVMLARAMANELE